MEILANDTLWLQLSEETAVAVKREEAERWTERDFAALYRRTCYGVSRPEARAWARAQVEQRDAFTKERRRKAVQSGQEAATSIPELVDALRQSTCGAAFDLGTIGTALEGHGEQPSIRKLLDDAADLAHEYTEPEMERQLREALKRYYAAGEALSRATNHVRAVDRKATLAFEAATHDPAESFLRATRKPGKKRRFLHELHQALIRGGSGPYE